MSAMGEERGSWESRSVPLSEDKSALSLDKGYLGTRKAEVGWVKGQRVYKGVGHLVGLGGWAGRARQELDVLGLVASGMGGLEPEAG